MAYATLQDLVDRLGEREVLELSGSETDAVNEVAVSRALADAQAEIDGYVGSRYPLPLATVPRSLVRISCDLARYFLSVAPDETVQRRYEEGRAFLRAVADGKVDLGADPQGAKPTATEGAQMTSGGRVWDRESSKGFI